jgi:hypothetical protein
MNEVDDRPQILEIWEPASDYLMIMLSGRRAGIHRTNRNLFNYMSLMEKYKHNKIFLRDPRQVSYQLGIAGISTNMQGTADYLAERVKERGIKKVAVMGTSAGGYAALAFGYAIKADEAHAFSAQTYLDVERRTLENLKGKDVADTKYYDLLPLLRDEPNGKTAYHLYYCFVPDFDRMSAERLGGLPGVHLHRYDHGGHQLAAYLARAGTLDEIISRFFNEELPADRPRSAIRPDSITARNFRGGAALD